MPDIQRTSSSTAALKLRPPLRHVPREALLARMLNARRRRCLVLTGPAGCGKSSLLRSWAQALVPLGYEVAWIDAGYDDDGLALAKRIQASLTDVLEDSDPATESETAAVGLLERILSCRCEVALIVDDVQRLGNSGFAFLQFLVDHAPANLHLVVAGRNALPLRLHRLATEQQAEDIDAEDMRLSPSETLACLRMRWPAIGEREARRLHDRCDGWVTGLQWLAAAIAPEMQPQARISLDLDFALATAQPEADAYFEREVMPLLDQPTLHWLIRISPCPRFCPALCASLLGDETPDGSMVGQAILMVERMLAQQLFVSPAGSDSSGMWYRFQPQWRDTLRRRFSRLSQEEQRDIHAAAARWFSTRGHFEEAVEQAVQAGDEEHAADMVERCARDLFVRGELRSLARLLRRLSPKQLARRSALQSWIARLQLYANDFGACRETIQRMERLASDAPAQFQVAMVRCALAVQLDDLEAARRELPVLLKPPPHADGLTLGARNNLVCWTLMHSGDGEAARAIHDTHRPPPVNGSALISTSFGLLAARAMSGLSYAIEGRMREADHAYRSVLHDAPHSGGLIGDPGTVATALLGEVLYESNEVHAAIDMLDGQVEVLQQVSIPDSVLRVHTVLARALRLIDRRADASGYVDALEAHALRLGLDRLLAEAWHLRLQGLLAELAAGEIDVVLTDLERLRKKHAAAGALSTWQEIPLIALHARADAEMARGRCEIAALALSELVDAYGRRRRWGRVAGCRMQLAAVEGRLGRPDRSRSLALAALEQGRQLGLTRTLLDAGPDVGAVLHELRNHGLPPVPAFQVNRLLADLQTPGTSREAAVTSASLQDLSARELEILSLLAQALPNKKIARSLGVSPETIKWHLKNVYGKLGVAGRDEAVARIRDLTELPSNSSAT